MSFFSCAKINNIISSKTYQRILKITALVIGAIFIFRLFSLDYFEVHLNNAVGVIPNVWLRKLYIILRAFTQAVLLISILNPFFKNRCYQLIMASIGVLVCISNLVLIKTNGQAFLGEQYNFFHVRVITYLFETLLVFFLCLSSLVKIIAQKDFNNLSKRLLKALGVFVCVVLVTLPLFTLTGLFGELKVQALSFSVIHRIYIYISFLIPLILYFSLRKTRFEVRYLTCVTIALGAFMGYFYKFSFADYVNVSSWPLHLCNTAIILMAIAFVFRSKTFFYFNYFINVLGALCAILMPNTTGYAFAPSVMHFWVNHWIAFALPLVAVALKVFPRPNFKMILKSILVFTIYFIVVAVVNSWFTNYDPGVNYFFLNDDFLARKMTFLLEIRKNNIYTFTIKDLTFVTYPVYWLIIYIGFIGLTFLTWFVYDLVFQTSDSLHELFYLKKLKKEIAMTRTKEIAEIRQSFLETSGEKMIKIEQFCKRYGKNTKNTVDNLNLQINEGEIFGFLGHNGAGKSTLIKSLVGIQSITSGRILVYGHDVASEPLATKLLIGYVPDNHAIYERLTGREYVNYIADLYAVPKEVRVERLNKYAAMFDLTEALDLQIKGYSHGMKQKITVISALIHDPKVWILDEPLTGLDPKSCYQIKECMKEHAAKGNIVFFSSHVIEVVESICDRIAIIRGGKLMLSTSVDELKKQPESLEKIFLKYVNASDEEIELILKGAKHV